MRGGEVDDGVDVAKLFGTESGAICVLAGAGSSDVMFALGGNFGYERSGFSAAEDEYFHSDEKNIEPRRSQRTAAKNAKDPDLSRFAAFASPWRSSRFKALLLP